MFDGLEKYHVEFLHGDMRHDFHKEKVYWLGVLMRQNDETL
jgi:hypothetical protein